MKFLHHLAGFVSAVCLMAILLITSVEAVAYWTPGYYEKEYTKYQVLEDLPEMTMEDLLAVTDEMIDYLRGDRDDLHVFTTMGGEYREFFNAREIAHMEDVRGLFLGGLTIRRTAFCILIACAVFLIASKANLMALVPKTMCLGMGAVFLRCRCLGGVIATDFNKYFVLFHHIFFDNDLWLLDPATDMLIKLFRNRFLWILRSAS